MNNSFATFAAVVMVAVVVFDQVFWQGAGLIGAGRLMVGIIGWLAFWR